MPPKAGVLEASPAELYESDLPFDELEVQAEPPMLNDSEDPAALVESSVPASEFSDEDPSDYYGGQELTLKEFLRRHGQHEILTAQEERKLARRVQAGIVEAPLTQKERHDNGLQPNIRLSSDDSQKAEHILIRHNYRLVAKHAYSYYFNRRHGEKHGLMDFFQVGVMGLQHAIRKFDPTRDIKLSTYATFWIKLYMERSLLYTATAIRSQADVQPKINQLRRLEASDKSDAEICDALQINGADLVSLRTFHQRIDTLDSLDRPVAARNGDPSSRTVGDFVAERPSGHDIVDEIADRETYEPEDDGQILAASPFLEKLRDVLRKNDLLILEKIMLNESINDSEKRRLLHLQGLLHHPGLQSYVRDCLPDELNSQLEISDQPSRPRCEEALDLYITRKTADRQAKNKMQELCGGCALRAMCRASFLEHRPVLGRWIDGITLEKFKKHPKSLPEK